MNISFRCSFLITVLIQYKMLPLRAKDVSFVAMKENPCQKFTLNNCTAKEDSIIETIVDIGMLQCQQFCLYVYTFCNMFTYDEKELRCELISEPLSEFIQSCNTITGPRYPEIESCLASEDECKVI